MLPTAYVTDAVFRDRVKIAIAELAIDTASSSTADALEERWAASLAERGRLEETAERAVELIIGAQEIQTAAAADMAAADIAAADLRAAVTRLLPLFAGVVARTTRTATQR